MILLISNSNFSSITRSRSRSHRRYSKSPRNNRNRSPRKFRKETRREDVSPKKVDRFERNDEKNSRQSEKVREPEKAREKPKDFLTSPRVLGKELPKKIEDPSSKKSVPGGQEKDTRTKQRNGGDYEKKREYQVKITEQKISYKETVRGKQPAESREKKISISSTSSPSRTPSPFLKPHERKDYVPSSQQKPPVDVEKTAQKNKNHERKRNTSESSVEVEKSSKKIVELTKKIDTRKVESKKKLSDESESRKRPAVDSDDESVTSEKKKKKKKNRDGSVSEEESERKKKRSKEKKKHKKSGKKSKKKDRSVSRDKSSESEQESNVNEDLEKKLREKALVSLMRKNSKKA